MVVNVQCFESKLGIIIVQEKVDRKESKNTTSRLHRKIWWRSPFPNRDKNSKQQYGVFSKENI